MAHRNATISHKGFIKDSDVDNLLGGDDGTAL